MEDEITESEIMKTIDRLNKLKDEIAELKEALSIAKRIRSHQCSRANPCAYVEYLVARRLSIPDPELQAKALDECIRHHLRFDLSIEDVVPHCLAKARAIGLDPTPEYVAGIIDKALAQ